MKLASGVTVSAAVTTVVCSFQFLLINNSWANMMDHADRPLTHINKKGRPVSQCAHCRGLRKSRTTHTKCECGDKKKNCHKNDSDSHTADRRDHKREHVGVGSLVHSSDLKLQRTPVSAVAATMASAVSVH